jgi:hypothetical protein
LHQILQPFIAYKKSMHNIWLNAKNSAIMCTLPQSNFLFWPFMWVRKSALSCRNIRYFWLLVSNYSPHACQQITQWMFIFAELWLVVMWIGGKKRVCLLELKDEIRWLNQNMEIYQDESWTSANHKNATDTKQRLKKLAPFKYPLNENYENCQRSELIRQHQGSN